MSEKTKIGLWDSNFPDAPSSVMGKESKYIEYVRNPMEFDGVVIFTDEHINADHVDQVQCKHKIGWLHEPFCLHPQTYARSLDNRRKFDAIMTYYKPLLDGYPGYVFAPYAGVWIPRSEWGMKPKTKNISMLIGKKMSTDGHLIRHKIVELLNRNGFEVDYYGAYGEPVDYSWQTKYKVLADYRYSIVSETCMEDNLFTEWLLDCFAVGTIPIFWGCPNVGDFFDDAGVLSFNDANDVAFIYPYLNEKHYTYLRHHAINNLKLIDRYEVSDDWFFKNVLEGKYLS